MKNTFRSPGRLIVQLALACGLSAFASTAAVALEETLQSASFQLFKLSDKSHPPGRWDPLLKTLVLDLRSLRALIEAHPDISPAIRQRLADLTRGDTQPFELRDTMLRDDVVHFSDYWTRPDSPLNIVDYRAAGSSRDLSPYLGPLAQITTADFGVARFEWRHQGEVLSFWSAVQRKRWTFSPKYWVNAQLLLPLEDPSNTDVAVLSLRIPTNHMASAATYLLVRRNP